VPPAFFNPFVFSLANLSDGHLPSYMYILADSLAILFSLFIVIGLYTRFALFGMFMLNSIFYSYYYSFGKIDHHTTILIFAFLTLAFTNMGTIMAMRKDKSLSMETQKNALAILAIIVCFGFFSGGFPKLLKWVDFDLNTSGFLFWFYPGYLLSHNQAFLSSYVFQIPSFLLECMDYAAALFETSAFIFLFRGKRSWLIYLMLACIFHLANQLILNIDFTLNVLTYGVFLVAPIIHLTIQKTKSFIRPLFAIGLVILIAIAKLIFVLIDESFQFLNYDSIDTSIKNWINLIIWIFTIACSLHIIQKLKQLTIKSVGERGDI